MQYTRQVEILHKMRHSLVDEVVRKKITEDTQIISYDSFALNPAPSHLSADGRIVRSGDTRDTPFISSQIFFATSLVRCLQRMSRGVREASTSGRVPS